MILLLHVLKKDQTQSKALETISPVPFCEIRKPNKKRQDAQKLTFTGVIGEKKKKGLGKQRNEENNIKTNGNQVTKKDKNLSKSKSVQPSMSFKKK